MRTATAGEARQPAGFMACRHLILSISARGSQISSEICLGTRRVETPPECRCWET
uniref:Uncharacterized protein n=1 Tax=Meleagris gallopavo TaxID=9103 RepID=A0A803YF21_MELGA